MTAACTLLIALSTVAGSPGPVLFEKGRDPADGVLVNCTVGADPAAAPDPGRLTIVFVHGANPTPHVIHFTMAQTLGQAVGRHYGASFNVLGWDWNAKTIVSLRAKRNMANAVEQGHELARSLLATGIDPGRLHLIGQSSGCIVAASAARALIQTTRRPVANLTLLDPARMHHELIFGKLAAGTTAYRVENYWVHSVSGYGDTVASPGVSNIRLDLSRKNGLIGLVRPLHSDHINAVKWYINSVDDPGSGVGFHGSIFFRR